MTRMLSDPSVAFHGQNCINKGIYDVDFLENESDYFHQIRDSEFTLRRRFLLTVSSAGCPCPRYISIALTPNISPI